MFICNVRFFDKLVRCSFSTGLFNFLLFNFKSPLFILNTSPLPDMCFEKAFLPFHGLFFNSLNNSVFHIAGVSNFQKAETIISITSLNDPRAARQTLFFSFMDYLVLYLKKSLQNLTVLIQQILLVVCFNQESMKRSNVFL